MMKGHKERSDDDLKTMERYLVSNPFFTNLKKECDREAILESFRVIQLQQFKAGWKVFEYGDNGD